MRQEHYADTTSGEQRYDVVYRPITHDNPSLPLQWTYPSPRDHPPLSESASTRFGTPLLDREIADARGDGRAAWDGGARRLRLP
jgi:hypothetical protein